MFPKLIRSLRRWVGIAASFVAVSLAAQSPWAVRDTGTSANLWGVAYRPPQTSGEVPEGVAVAVGEQGVILTSADEGLTWTRRASGVTTWLTAVTYDTRINQFFAVGEGGTVLTSFDAVTWRREPTPTTVRLNAVAMGPAQTVLAIGEAGAGVLVRDASGTWTHQDAGFGRRWMRGLLMGGNVAVGQDGALYTAQSDESTTPPTLSWRPQVLPVSADLEAVTLGSFFQGPQPVAVGANGLIVQGSGSVWTPRNSGTTQRLRGVCWKEGGRVTIITVTATRSMGEFFAVGTAGTLLRSADGVSWAADASPSSSNLNAVCGTLRAVIAVGDAGTILRTGGSGDAPTITQVPATAADALGPYAVAEVAGSGQFTYLWVQLSAGAPYPVGSDFPRQSLARAPFGVFGAPFQLLVGNAFGVTRSPPFSPHRFLNLACRGVVGTGDKVLIGGFVVGGTDLPRPRTVLVRAVGPGLSAFGVGNPLRAPRLSVYSGSVLLATNAGWEEAENAGVIQATARSAGAFPLAAGSGDCALVLSLPPGNYTAQVTSADGSSGTALVEVYDTEPPDLARLKNLSARGQVVTGSDLLIGGLVIEGGVRKSVLLRAAGPALQALGLSGWLARPQFTLFRAGAPVATATAWGEAPNASEIRAAGIAVSAFPFADRSADAAMLLPLEPGAYTLQVSGADNGGGIAVVEVYEVPQ